MLGFIYPFPRCRHTRSSEELRKMVIWELDFVRLRVRSNNGGISPVEVDG